MKKLIIPESKLILAGQFNVEHYRKGRLLEIIPVRNGITDVGIEHMLDVTFNSETAEADWYMGLIGTLSSLAAGDTAASHTGWAEFDDIVDAAWPGWGQGAADDRTVTNGTPVEFEMDLMSPSTVRGMFIISDDSLVTSSGTGVLWSTAAFGSPIAVDDEDVLKVTYTLQG